MLPEGRLSTEPIISGFLDPHQLSLRDPLVDYEKGGVAIQDPSQGLQVRNWKAFVQEDGVWLQGGDDPPFLYIPGVKINFVSLAFDQNMNPVVVYMKDEVLRMYWYDTLIEGMRTTEYPMMSAACVTLDDKRETQRAVSDVLLVYIEDDGIWYRQQRDRYTIPYYLASLPYDFVLNPKRYCDQEYCDEEYTGWHFDSFYPEIYMNLGMGTNNRLIIELGVANAEKS